MRYLTRSESPTVLGQKDYATQIFDSLSPTQKKAIWRALRKMQDDFCAYCEKKIKKNHRHIEHFYPKKTKPDDVTSYMHLTFEWSNLFGCCNAKEHCGHFKDGGKEYGAGEYSPDNLVKPDTHNPNEFFLYAEDGKVLIREALSEESNYRAEETIRVFNLNMSALANSRQTLIGRFSDRLSAILKLKESGTMPDEDLEVELNKIKEEINTFEHRTAVEAVVLLG